MKVAGFTLKVTPVLLEFLDMKEMLQRRERSWVTTVAYPVASLVSPPHDSEPSFPLFPSERVAFSLL